MCSEIASLVSFSLAIIINDGQSVCAHVVLLDDVISWQKLTRVQIKYIFYDALQLDEQSQSGSQVKSSY